VPHWSLKLVTPPAVEPVDSTLMRLHARIDVTDDDAALAIYIAAARRWCEEYCGRQLISAQWRLTMDYFPPSTGMAWPQWAAGAPAAGPAGADPYLIGLFEPGSQAIRLPRPPLVTVDSVQYVNAAGQTVTLDPGLYLVDSDSEPARINPLAGGAWPPTAFQPSAVIVTYTAGYGAAGLDIPENIRLAIMQLAAHWYANRESQAPGTFAEVPMTTKALLSQDRVWEY
jgi:hypothetical protein